MTDKTELLPCPFCGSNNLRHEIRSHSFVECLDCGCDGPLRPHMSASKDAWNARAAPAEDACPPLIKTLRDNGELVALKATVAQQAKMIEALQAEDVRAVGEEPVAHTLAEKVREALDRKACPNVWMVIAYEAVVSNYASRPVVLPERLREVWLFLDGQAELNGCVFGEKPEGRHNFWWRKELRAALEELYPPQ
ncbi:Lar family restriction alleviation protein [Pseudomonas typographi]|uniref:Restriction alleviation protein, Lar family n=1 Tax=Pseudomonas typographi TaxID=2715964 RepID=A0ABR7ZAM1_9PSED|nr:Lar family restriction alleviation protein [Pseudomonas typographi]MBD1602407.1 hypothetical protein [Pseudomonas typographi]